MDTSTFLAALTTQLRAAAASGATQLTVVAGELHRKVGGYPKAGHRMPTCCDVMRAAMRPGDEVVREPPKGKGATLTIRYRLPRSG